MRNAFLAIVLAMSAHSQVFADTYDESNITDEQGINCIAEDIMTIEGADISLSVVDSLAPLSTDTLKPMVMAEDTTSLGMMVDASTVVKKVKKKTDWTTWKPDPKRAMWLALVIPGAGQIYNRKYWKLPIVYGGFLGCVYAMRWNNQMYLDYSQAYLDIMDTDPSTKSYEQFLHLGTQVTSANEERFKQIFKTRKDRYRRWRDMSFFVMLGVYALSVIDAYVDASLSQFDISDDLSLHLEPAVIGTQGNAKQSLRGNQGIGVSGALTF